MAEIFSDNFNRTDANLEDSPDASGGGTWTHDGAIAGGAKIVSNVLTSTTADSTGTAYFASDLGTMDHFVQYAAPSTTADTGTFACARMTDKNNFIGIRTGASGGDGRIQVYRRISGTLTQLWQSVDSVFVVGDVIRLEVNGTTWKVVKNGVDFGSGSSGQIGDGGVLTSTKTGIVARAVASVQVCDDFQTGGLGATDYAFDATGFSATSAVGDVSIALGVNLDITGADATGAVGDVIVSLPTSFAVTGVEGTTSLGDAEVSLPEAISVTGVSATGSVGDVTAAFIKNSFLILDGLSATTALGDQTIVSENILSVDGFEMEADLGILGLGNWFPVNLSATETWTRVIV